MTLPCVWFVLTAVSAVYCGEDIREMHLYSPYSFDCLSFLRPYNPTCGVQTAPPYKPVIFVNQCEFNMANEREIPVYQWKPLDECLRKCPELKSAMNRLYPKRYSTYSTAVTRRKRPTESDESMDVKKEISGDKFYEVGGNDSSMSIPRVRLQYEEVEETTGNPDAVDGPEMSYDDDEEMNVKDQKKDYRSSYGLESFDDSAKYDSNDFIMDYYYTPEPQIAVNNVWSANYTPQSYDSSLHIIDYTADYIIETSTDRAATLRSNDSIYAKSNSTNESKEITVKANTTLNESDLSARSRESLHDYSGVERLSTMMATTVTQPSTFYWSGPVYQIQNDIPTGFNSGVERLSTMMATTVTQPSTFYWSGPVYQTQNDIPTVSNSGVERLSTTMATTVTQPSTFYWSEPVYQTQNDIPTGSKERQNVEETQYFEETTIQEKNIKISHDRQLYETTGNPNIIQSSETSWSESSPQTINSSKKVRDIQSGQNIENLNKQNNVEQKADTTEHSQTAQLTTISLVAEIENYEENKRKRNWYQLFL